MTSATRYAAQVEALPAQLYLEVTNRCNLRCRTCPQSWGMPEPFADLTAEQVQRIVDQLPRLDRVVLHGIGESILNHALPDIIRIVKARGAWALMNTNGTVLGRRRLEPVLRAGLDELRISIDAATPETYAHVRGANSLQKIVRNIAVVQELKRELGIEHPKLSLWMTGLHDSLPELPALVRLAADVGVREVYLQRLVTSERGLAQSEGSLYGAAEQAAGPIAEAEALAAELGISFQGSGNTTGGDSVRPAVEDAPWRACTRPWNLMYVTANGNALPCCIAPFTDTPHDELVLGNVFEAPVADVWRGKGYAGWRQAMLEGEPPTPCAGCGVDWSL